MDKHTTLKQFKESDLGRYLKSNGCKITYNTYFVTKTVIEYQSFYFEFTSEKFITEDMLNLLDPLKIRTRVDHNNYHKYRSDLKILLETWFRKEKIKKILS